MRSEEGAGGPGAAVAARGPSGKEKLPALEVQFRRESPRREPEAPPTPSPGCGSGAGKPREEKRTVLSKVVIRRLPPSLTREQLEEQLCPLPAHDYFEFFTADFSLYPHLYSRAYINFRNPDDILLFRDRFDGYIFIDSKGLEYPAVVEFAPFQKIARKKLKKKDAKTGSIEDDPEYKKFLETYRVEEEKTSANPETLLGDIEARTRALPARRTTPLLEYIKSRRLEKQRIREEKREERRRRDLEKKRLREEEKRKSREEEQCQRREADRHKRAAERGVRVQLLKKPDKGEEPAAERPDDRGQDASGAGEGRREPPAGCAPLRPEGPAREPLQRSRDGGDQELVDVERGFREEDPDTLQGRPGEGRGPCSRREPGRPWRRGEDELKWGRGKKGGQDLGAPAETAKRPGREKSEEGPAPRKEHVGDKDRPAGQLRQPGARGRGREEGGGAEAESPGTAAPGGGDSL